MKFLTTIDAKVGINQVQATQLTASSTTPWQISWTYPVAFVNTPTIVATCVSSIPFAAVPVVVSASNTSCTIYDSSQSNAVFNVIAVGT